MNEKMDFLLLATENCLNSVNALVTELHNANKVNEKQILDFDDLMKEFGFGKTKMRQFLERGTLPAVKIGSQWRITRTQLEKWFEENSGMIIEVE